MCWSNAILKYELFTEINSTYLHLFFVHKDVLMIKFMRIPNNNNSIILFLIENK